MHAAHTGSAMGARSLLREGQYVPDGGMDGCVLRMWEMEGNEL